MKLEANRQAIGQLFEDAFDARKLEVLDELVAINGVSHKVAGVQAGESLEGFRQETKSFLEVFPDA